MHLITHRFKHFILAFVLMSTIAAHAMDGASQGQEILVQTSLFTSHYKSRTDHNNDQKLVNIEWLSATDYEPAWLREGSWSDRLPWLDEVRWLVGAAMFDNSFSQRSTLVYGGGRYDFWKRGQTRLYSKVTFGLLHGYRGEYRDKIPFNKLGIAPVVLPALGLHQGRVNLELVPFGTAGIMFNFGLYFPK